MVQPVMPSDPAVAPAKAGSRVFARNVVWLGLGYASMYFLVASLVWSFAGYNPILTAPGKLIGITGDVVLGIIMTVLLWQMRDLRLTYKALAGCGLSLVLAPFSAFVDWGWYAYCVYPLPATFDTENFAQVMLFTTSELFGWSCLYLALQYSDHVREAEQRMAAVRQEALAAQMRALQYQVNPHFLFNTLNSVAGLIEENASVQAHDMLLGLASFLRQTVTLNPEHDIRLGDELAIQMNYLGIEKVRFSDRLQVRTEVAAGLEALLVPPLILQPLVENAVKYGISQMQGPAELMIGVAAEPEGKLRLWVENSVPPNGTSQAAGLGIGLENVSHRLQARWPGQSTFEATLSAQNRFKVQITLPMVWGRQ